MHDLNALCGLLTLDGFRVAIETSGQHAPPAQRDGVWITLSPKLDMPGCATPHASALAAADEIKMPVGKARDIARLRELLVERRALAPAKRPPLVYLQPLSQSPAATALCVSTITREEPSWRLSVQQHKCIGLR